MPSAARRERARPHRRLRCAVEGRRGYRYDERKRMMMKTVELVVEEVPWIPGSARHVFVDVKYGETRLRAAMRNVGGRWSRERRLWEKAPTCRNPTPVSIMKLPHVQTLPAAEY
jgi:hypothetical protein